MSDLIGCRSCTSPYCQGCNIKILSDMLRQGKFDYLMNENRAISKEPVRHGHWIRHDDELLGLTEECSECHCEGMVHGNYCPNCGADMRKENR